MIECSIHVSILLSWHHSAEVVGYVRMCIQPNLVITVRSFIRFDLIGRQNKKIYQSCKTDIGDQLVLFA